MFKSCLVPAHHACKHKGFSDLDMENSALHAAASYFCILCFCMIQNRHWLYQLVSDYEDFEFWKGKLRNYHNLLENAAHILTQTVQNKYVSLK